MIITYLRDFFKRLFYRPKPSGSLEQPKDSRDLKFHKELTVGSIPKSTIPSLFEWSSLPNQGRTNACVGFGIARLLEILIHQVVKEETGDDWYDNISELFIWYLAREVEGTLDKNVGVIPRNAFKAVFKHGYLVEKYMPFVDSHRVYPDEYERAAALFAREMLLKMKFKYYAVRKSDALRLAKKGQAVGVALPMNNTWGSRWTKDVRPTGGYHYMVLEGVLVKNDVEYCKFANSWGKGYLYIPKSYFMKHALS
jgi:hypothetical protein